MRPKLERLPAVVPIDPAEGEALRAVVEGKSRPGSFGRLEPLAVRLSQIRQTRSPRIERVAVLVFAADRGDVVEQASATSAVRTVLAGHAAVNAAARAIGADITVVDAGLAETLPAHKNLLVERIGGAAGRNSAEEAALTDDEALDALARGARIANQSIGAGSDAIVPASLGEGERAAAALLAHRLAPAELDAFMGEDATSLDRQRAHARAAARSAATEPLEALRESGSAGIAMMAGTMIGAASRRRPVLVDGFTSTVAALVAIRLRPAVQHYCIFTHRAAEPGHDVVLSALGERPLLDLELASTAGAGALLAVPILRTAASIPTEMVGTPERRGRG